MSAATERYHTKWAIYAAVAAISCGSGTNHSTDDLQNGTGGSRLGSGGTPNSGGNPAQGGSNSTGGGPDPGGGSGGLETGSGGAATTGGSAAGGNSAGGAAPGSGGVPIVGSISDLTVEPNPRNTLSAWVTWTTSLPSSSVVQFGEDELTWQTEGEENVTQHRVLLIGMHADSTYQIRALSSSDNGMLEGSTTFLTGALPAQVPVGAISVHDDARTQPGWTLMNVQKGDGTNRATSGAPPAAVIYDEAGLPVWYYIYGTTNERGGAISVDPTDKGVLIGPTLSNGAGPAFAPIEVDWAGETVWTCEDPLCGVPDQLSHHAGKLSNGNYVVMRDASTMGGRVSQVFLEFAPDSPTPVHQIGVEDAMTPPTAATGDWAHGNAITVDLEQDVAYLSFRWLGVIKMEYSTRTPLWHLPASYGEEALGDFGDMEFIPPESQYSDIHDPEIHDDGTILIFDNGGFTGQIQDGNPANLHTRALEYLIDETSTPRTAQLVWEWPGSFAVDPWYTTELYVPFWGDADRLENGNVMITAGRRGTSESTPESRIIEVTKDTGEVVWELRLPKDHGVYRAERLSPLPMVRRLE